MPWSEGPAKLTRGRARCCLGENRSAGPKLSQSLALQAAMPDPTCPAPSLGHSPHVHGEQGDDVGAVGVLVEDPVAAGTHMAGLRPVPAWDQVEPRSRGLPQAAALNPRPSGGGGDTIFCGAEGEEKTAEE